jgi:hypothetical protein
VRIAFLTNKLKISREDKIALYFIVEVMKLIPVEPDIAAATFEVVSLGSFVVAGTTGFFRISNISMVLKDSYCTRCLGKRANT